jgi:hypothetical protein
MRVASTINLYVVLAGLAPFDLFDSYKTYFPDRANYQSLVVKDRSLHARVGNFESRSFNLIRARRLDVHVVRYHMPLGADWTLGSGER